jgi:CBS domain-containing protein
MARIDAGILPVGENDKLIGMITDRDIAVRAVGQGRDPSVRVRDVMSPEVKYCFEDEDIGHAESSMSELKVRRLLVVDRAKRLVGIISLGDIAKSRSSRKVGRVLREVTQPGGQHSQTAP